MTEARLRVCRANGQPEAIAFAPQKAKKWRKLADKLEVIGRLTGNCQQRHIARKIL